LRRHHLRRMKRKARRVLSPEWEWREYAANHMAVCSCQMCRNPRHSVYNSGDKKLTLQERKASLDWTDFLEDDPEHDREELFHLMLEYEDDYEDMVINAFLTGEIDSRLQF